MIAKIKSISYTLNALNYCKKGGEILYTNKCLGGINDINNQFEQNQALNDRCLNKSFHAKIRIAPEDKGILSKQDFIDIALKYALTIGFNNNPFVVFMHEEGTNKEHIHIVASRINESNKAISDSYTNYKNLDFCRKIEQEYNLRKVERVYESYKEKGYFKHKDNQIESVKKHIDEAISFSDGWDDFIFLLKNENISIKKGRGIAFITKEGVSIKGSAIGKEYSKTNIEKRINNIPIKSANKNVPFSRGENISIGL